jgi:beta-lactamase regulating signal transducer with metallopeptidase domain
VELQVATGLRALGSQLGLLTALLTYSLHAALWAGVVAWLTRWRAVPFALRHTAWKLALLAPLATTFLTLSVPSSFEHGFEKIAYSPHVAGLSLNEPSHDANGATSPTEATRRLLAFSGTCLLLAAALGVARFAGVAGAQWRRLGPRRRVTDARLLARLQGLLEPLALGEVRLTESAGIDCPLVVGAREICIPLATLAALDDAEVDAVLAHELAHVERGDALWFPLFGVVRAALWFHPITRWVSGQVRQSAELACDERCLELTGEPLALARALTRIAARALGAQHAVAFPAMTQPRSSLVARVARLTSDPQNGRSHFSWQSRTGMLVSLGAVALVSLASSVRVAEAQPARTLVSAPRAGAERGASMAELGMQMAELTRREQWLEAEQASLSTSSAPRVRGENPSPRLLEVEQELRHVHQMQAYLEALVSGE